MDLKSLVRTFRYTELQQRADLDPNAKRPPTIKFLGVAFALGVVIVALGLIFLESRQPGQDSGGTLSQPDETPANNETGRPTPTGGAAAEPGPGRPAAGPLSATPAQRR